MTEISILSCKTKSTRLSSGCVVPVSAIIDAMQVLAFPTNGKAVKNFLSTSVNYRHFCSNYTDIAKLLIDFISPRKILFERMTVKWLLKNT